MASRAGNALGRRAFGTLIEKGLYEAGRGGRSSVSGITVAVFGGTGFLGKYFMFELGKTGYRAYLPVRGDMEDARPFKVAFDLGQFAALPYSLRDTDSIKRCMEGADVVVNLVGKYYETKHLVPSKKADGKLCRINYAFEDIHIDAPAKIGECAKAMGVERMIHVSALGAREDHPSRFLSTKAKGEAALRSVFPSATIVRPGRLYGPEDRLFNWFANMAASFPVLPLFEGGKSLLQPTYVCDVADALVTIIENEKYDGRTFELAGDLNFTYQEVADFTYDITWQKPRVLEVPSALGDLVARVTESLPNPILTRDEVIQWTHDNVLDPESSTLRFADLGMKPTPIQKVVFNYLYRFREGGHFPYAEGYHL